MELRGWWEKWKGEYKLERSEFIFISQEEFDSNIMSMISVNCLFKLLTRYEGLQERRKVKES